MTERWSSVSPCSNSGLVGILFVHPLLPWGWGASSWFVLYPQSLPQLVWCYKSSCYLVLASLPVHTTAQKFIQKQVYLVRSISLPIPVLFLCLWISFQPQIEGTGSQGLHSPYGYHISLRQFCSHFLKRTDCSSSWPLCSCQWLMVKSFKIIYFRSTDP